MGSAVSVKQGVFALGLALFALLVGCRARPPSESQPAAAQTGPQAPIVLTSPALAKERVDPKTFLDPVPPSFRSLGGATELNGTAIAFSPLSDEVSEDHAGVAMMHGLWFAVHAHDPIEQAASRECVGSGADHEHPIALNSAKGRGWIDDVLPCALTKVPGTTWRATELIADDRHFYSVVLLQEPSGVAHRVYADITPWAEDFISQLK